MKKNGSYSFAENHKNSDRRERESTQKKEKAKIVNCWWRRGVVCYMLAAFNKMFINSRFLICRWVCGDVCGF